MSKRIYTPAAVSNAQKAQNEIASRDEAESALQPGPFPIDELNKVQRPIVEAVADVHQLPIELAAMPALAVLGAAMGKGWKLTGAVNGRDNFANIYVVPGAPKSTGKGAAAQLAYPIILASAKLVEHWSANQKPKLETQRSILEARAQHLTGCLARRRDGTRSLSAKDLNLLELELLDANAKLECVRQLLATAPSYHVGNATSEALAMKFARNDDTLFALSYEGGDTLRVMLGKYSKDNRADCDLWLSGYSVEPYQSDRVGRGNVNITPCLTGLIFCQPSLIRELYGNAEAFERGLTARLMPFISEPTIVEDDGKPRIIPVYHSDAWSDLILGLLERRTAERPPVKCSPAAREVLREFHNESVRLRNGDCKDIQGELGRWRENACRIALGQCIADDPNAETLTKDQAHRAVIIARWAQRSALQVLHNGRMAQRSMRVDKLMDLLSSSGCGVTLRQLEKSHGFKPEEVKALAAEFPAQLRIETKQNPNGGPQSPILIRTPLAFR